MPREATRSSGARPARTEVALGTSAMTVTGRAMKPPGVRTKIQDWPACRTTEPAGSRHCGVPFGCSATLAFTTCPGRNESAPALHQHRRDHRLRRLVHAAAEPHHLALRRGAGHGDPRGGLDRARLLQRHLEVDPERIELRHAEQRRRSRDALARRNAEFEHHAIARRIDRERGRHVAIVVQFGDVGLGHAEQRQHLLPLLEGGPGVVVVGAGGQQPALGDDPFPEHLLVALQALPRELLGRQGLEVGPLRFQEVGGAQPGYGLAGAHRFVGPDQHRLDQAGGGRRHDQELLRRHDDGAGQHRLRRSALGLDARQLDAGGADLAVVYADGDVLLPGRSWTGQDGGEQQGGEERAQLQRSAQADRHG